MAHNKHWILCVANIFVSVLSKCLMCIGLGKLNLTSTIIHVGSALFSIFPMIVKLHIYDKYRFLERKMWCIECIPAAKHHIEMMLLYI